MPTAAPAARPTLTPLATPASAPKPRPEIVRPAEKARREAMETIEAMAARDRREPSEPGKPVIGPLRPKPEPFVPRPSTDVSDLVAAMAANADPEIDQTVNPNRVIQMPELRNMSNPTPPSTEAVPPAAAPAGPVRFTSRTDPWATRAMVFAVLGFVLCVFPVVSLVGLVLGLMSMRRIASNDGLLGGLKTARLAVIVGAGGLVGGVVIDLIFLLKKH